MAENDRKVVNLSGVARPSRFLRRLAGLHASPTAILDIPTVIEDARMVKGVQVAMEAALQASTNASGAVDMEAAALHFIQTMLRNQKT